MAIYPTPHFQTKSPRLCSRRNPKALASCMEFRTESVWETRFGILIPLYIVYIARKKIPSHKRKKIPSHKCQRFSYCLEPHKNSFISDESPRLLLILAIRRRLGLNGIWDIHKKNYENSSFKNDGVSNIWLNQRFSPEQPMLGYHTATGSFLFLRTTLTVK